MPNNDKLPPEILRKIVEEVNILGLPSLKCPADVDGNIKSGKRVCGSSGTTFTRVVEDYSRVEKSTVRANFCRPNAIRAKPTAILNAMRVCRYWRNMAFSILYKEDVSNWKWTAEDWTVCRRMMQLRELENLLMHGPTNQGCTCHWEERCEEGGLRNVGMGGSVLMVQLMGRRWSACPTQQQCR